MAMPLRESLVGEVDKGLRDDGIAAGCEPATGSSLDGTHPSLNVGDLRKERHPEKQIDMFAPRDTT